MFGDASARRALLSPRRAWLNEIMSHRALRPTPPVDIAQNRSEGSPICSGPYRGSLRVVCAGVSVGERPRCPPPILVRCRRAEGHRRLRRILTVRVFTRPLSSSSTSRPSQAHLDPTPGATTVRPRPQRSNRRACRAKLCLTPAPTRYPIPPPTSSSTKSQAIHVNRRRTRSRAEPRCPGLRTSSNAVDLSDVAHVRTESRVLLIGDDCVAVRRYTPAR